MFKATIVNAKRILNEWIKVPLITFHFFEIMKTLCELQWLNKGAPLWANAGQPECATFASVTLKRAGLAGWHWLYCVWQAAIIVLAIHNCCAYLDYNVLCAGKKGTQLQSHCRDEEERKNNLSWDKNVISFEDSSLSLTQNIHFNIQLYCPV